MIIYNKCAPARHCRRLIGATAAADHAISMFPISAWLTCSWPMGHGLRGDARRVASKDDQTFWYLIVLGSDGFPIGPDGLPASSAYLFPFAQRCRTEARSAAQQLTASAARHPQLVIRQTVEDVKREVGRSFGVRLGDIMAADRHQGIALARHVAMYLARHHLGLSFPKIGEVFQKDHSTVVYACDKVAKRREADPSFLFDLCKIEEALQRQRDRTCAHCGAPHQVSDHVAEESPFCADCLHDRVERRAAG